MSPPRSKGYLLRPLLRPSDMIPHFLTVRKALRQNRLWLAFSLPLALTPTRPPIFGQRPLVGSRMTHWHSRLILRSLRHLNDCFNMNLELKIIITLFIGWFVGCIGIPFKIRWFIPCLILAWTPFILVVTGIL